MDPLSSRERQRLDDDGYLALEGLVDHARARAMRSRLEELLAVTEQSHAGTLIVGGLLDEPVFDAAWNHPLVLAAVRRVLGDDHRLLGLASHGLRPGHGQQALHVDWGGQGIPGVWYACHAICALVDFTEENGATRVLPGSHRNPWMLKNVRAPPQASSRAAAARRPGGDGLRPEHPLRPLGGAEHVGRPSPRTLRPLLSPLLLADPHAAPGPETLARFDEETRAIFWV